MKCLMWSVVLLLAPVTVLAGEAVAPINVQERCRQEGQAHCIGVCSDGWSRHCYYDPAVFQIETNFSPDAQKANCYAFYDMSVCEPCRNTYQIRQKDVSCEEFYQAVNQQNNDCGGCLRHTGAAGG